MRVSSLVLLLAVAILFAAVPDTSAKNFWSKVKDAVENTVEDVKNTAKGVARFAKKIGKCGGSCKKAMKGCHKLCFKSGYWGWLPGILLSLCAAITHAGLLMSLGWIRVFSDLVSTG